MKNRYLNRGIFCLMGLLCLGWLGQSQAAYFHLPKNGDVVGHVKIVKARYRTLSQIGRQYDIGYYEMVEANPQLSPNRVPYGAKVVIPSKYILPTKVHKGIVINLAELRLYYFMPKRHEVFTVPIGIGRVGWKTPTGDMKIIGRRKNPTWTAPQSVIKENAAKGITVPKKIPPGPYNPLGKYALRLSQPSYLIHGTNVPSGVGKRVSSGCIRMYAEDIRDLYNMARVGTNVHIVNKSMKAGWSGNKLYLEAHVPLSEAKNRFGDGDKTALIEKALAEITTTHPASNINWSAAKSIAKEMMGIPQVVGTLAQPEGSNHAIQQEDNNGDHVAMHH